jgi:hypothetical protein
MSTIEKSIDVNVPASSAYNQWTQFEDFSSLWKAFSRCGKWMRSVFTGVPTLAALKRFLMLRSPNRYRTNGLRGGALRSA